MRAKGKKNMRSVACSSRKKSAVLKLNTRGFTLTELVIVIVVIGILSGVAALIILQGVRAYYDEQSRSEVHYQARIAVERIAREARHIRSCIDIAGPANPSDTLAFNDISGTAVNFNVAVGNLTRGADVLATGVVSAQPFSFLAVDGVTPTTACPGIWFVQINLTSTQGTSTLQIRTLVHPMNF